MRRRLTIAVTLLVVSSGSVVRAGKLEDAVDKGNRAFMSRQYKEAMEQYQIAETERPEAPELEYNIAGVLHEQQQYEEAVDRYMRALNSEDVGVTADAHYNLASTYFRMGDYQKAITGYEASLRLRPDDMSAKYNLELSRRLLKEQMQAQPQDQNQQNQQQQQQQQQQQDQQQQDQQNDQQSQEQQQAQQSQEDEQDKDQQQEQSQAQAQEKPMSKEDAERILNALADDEKDVQKQIKRQVVGGDYVGKDW